MAFYEKAKEWIKETGLINLGWIAAFAVTSFLGWWLGAGVALGIFCYTNWNVVRKLYNKATGKGSESVE